MLFTGLQLYVHGLASGHSSIGAWWPAMLHLVTDWTLYVLVEIWELELLIIMLCILY